MTTTKLIRARSVPRLPAQFVPQIFRIVAPDCPDNQRVRMVPPRIARDQRTKNVVSRVLTQLSDPA